MKGGNKNCSVLCGVLVFTLEGSTVLPAMLFWVPDVG
jgi:hypothetical protein